MLSIALVIAAGFCQQEPQAEDLKVLINRAGALRKSAEALEYCVAAGEGTLLDLVDGPQAIGLSLHAAGAKIRAFSSRVTTAVRGSGSSGGMFMSRGGADHCVEGPATLLDLVDR